MKPTTRRQSPSPPVERPDTVLETDDEIRQALLSGANGQQQDVPVDPKAAPSGGQNNVRLASPFRPMIRPRFPVLTVFDDGKIDGEPIRIREARFTIGRTEGDLRIPLDGRISSRHIEIAHQVVGGLHRWVVTDLQSLHGMFVRVTRTALADGAEFLVGSGRYTFDAGQRERDETDDDLPSGRASRETHGWSETPGPSRRPALTEMLGRDIGNRVLLVKDSYWIGSDPSCPISRPDDPFCEARHVRIFRGARGNWHAEHNKTPNGLWLRMTQIVVETTVQFQIGEQRFKLKVN